MWGPSPATGVWPGLARDSRSSCPSLTWGLSFPIQKRRVGPGLGVSLPETFLFQTLELGSPLNPGLFSGPCPQPGPPGKPAEGQAEDV